MHQCRRDSIALETMEVSLVSYPLVRRFNDDGIDAGLTVDSAQRIARLICDPILNVIAAVPVCHGGAFARSALCK
jgi:hypothetical protein